MCIYIYIMFICVSIDIIIYLYTILYDISRSQYHIIEYDILSLVAQTLKHLPTMWETQVQSLSQEALLEKEMATYSSTLAWKIPWMEEPGRLQSMGSGLQRVGHDWATSLSLSYMPEDGENWFFLGARTWSYTFMAWIILLFILNKIIKKINKYLQE